MMAACECQRDVALHPGGDGDTGNLPGHGPAPSLGLLLATAMLPQVMLLRKEMLTCQPAGSLSKAEGWGPGCMQRTRRAAVEKAGLKKPC